MNPTQQVARRYYDAWTSGDRHTVTTLLAPTFSFAAFAPAGEGTEGRGGGGRG